MANSDAPHEKEEEEEKAFCVRNSFFQCVNNKY